ncbi:DUF3999 family protein [Winogradskyella forsetii]|uniref:DUF3999 family protein n=1 Tax=Winogradskyella forsetii TaxID=2686077 RepID=UPI0015BDE924|nr:DUF3999 family protein [Winogradskyella forsetii]
MMLKTKLFAGFLIGFTVFCSAQMETYNFKRELTNVNDEWHQLTLPNTLFGKLNSDLNDLRIYGTTENDTIEAPYFLEVLSDKIVHKSIPFKIINKTKSDNNYYFTFQLDSENTINQINLNFNDTNFDWKVGLEGSQNQKEWFTILEDYRILAIKNEVTNFKFTTLEFPETKYRFYRLIIKHNEQPELESAQLSKHEITKGNSVKYLIESLKTKEDKQLKATTINAELELPIALSQIEIDVSNSFDYYRPLKIEYRSDSTKTEKGWKYHYKTITSGTLNSLEANRFLFGNTIAKHLKITIYNSDNQPLTISDVTAKGYEYRLIGRFTEPADYTLVYGNPSAIQPNYDINKFKSKIPNDLKPLKVGAEEVILKPEQQKVTPLFENGYWLWAIIGVVILVLGGFTLRMLRKG